MALIDAPVNASSPQYVGFRANNAPEMALLLTQWFEENEALAVMDIELRATGAAPNFFCTLVAGSSSGSTPTVLGQDATAVVVGGVGTVDPVAMAAELGAAVRALDPDIASAVRKAVVAGGGAGPHWMAIVLAAASPE